MNITNNTSMFMQKTCNVLDETEDYYIYDDINGKEGVIRKDDDNVNVQSIVIRSIVR